jgi:hypothetical protein
VGWPLHRIGVDGDVLSSFGADTAKFDPRLGTYVNSRTIASVAHTDDVCAAYQSAYVIQCWDRGGRKTAEIRRSPSWFRGSEVSNRGFYDEFPPVSMIGSFSADRRDRIWVASVVPDSKWTARKPEDRPGPGESGLASGNWLLDLETFLDSMYEVLDLRTGALLASQRDPRPPGQYIEGGLLALHRETPLGFVVIEVYRPRIVQR